MDDTQKMLRAIINGQSALKQELLGEIKKVNDEVNGLRQDFSKFMKVTEENFDKVHKRIDKIGSQLAYLEDDAPTRSEFNKLKRRVKKLETEAVSA